MPKKAKGRTLDEFRPLRPAEEKLLQACETGDVAEISANRPTEKTDANSVRASFLRFLTLGGDEQAPVHDHGVQLNGAWIEGQLALEAARVPTNIFLVHCHFETAPVLRDARIAGTLNLGGCQVPGIQGDRLTCNGGVFMGQGFITTDVVSLLGAQIGGSLDCNGATFDGKEGDSLLADGAVIKGDVFFNEGFKATGAVRLLGAQIGGVITCSGATFDGKEGKSLSADRAVIKGSVFFNEGFKATGAVRLLGAQIGGSFSCSSATFDGKEGVSLSADGAVIKGSVFFNEGFKATGAVRLLGAQIGGNLECNGATFDGKEGDSLSAERAVIKGHVFFNEGFKATGEVRLLGAQIGGNLECSGAIFDGKEGDSLSPDGAVIKGSVFFNEGFKATGAVSLLGAQIGGSFSCSSATFDGKEGNSLLADGAVIKGSVFFNEGFKATGAVRLLGAQIGGNLDCEGATFDSKGGVTLLAGGLLVNGSFFFQQLKKPINGISLSSCHVGRLIDDENSWGDNITLDGFTYDHIAGDAPTDALTRLAWLAKQSSNHTGVSNKGTDFKPQPWQQLIRVLRAMGHEEDARQVAIAREKHLHLIGYVGQTPPEWGRVRAMPYRFAVRTFHRLFGLLIAYGYRPLRLVAWMFLVWLLLGIGYWAAAQQAVFAPSNPLVFNHPAYAHCRPDYQPDPKKRNAKVGNWFTCPELAGEYTGFSPLIYSLDLILPLVDLQQERDWAPIIPTPKAVWYEELAHFSPNHLTRWLVWFETLFGWVASLLLVAVLTGLANRDKG